MADLPPCLGGGALTSCWLVEYAISLVAVSPTATHQPRNTKL